MAEHQIRFEDGAAYERMMGVWSRLAGDIFLEWLAPPPGLRWIDVGCGSGAFSQLLFERCAPAEIRGVDPSEAQLAFARARPAARLAQFHQGDAMALPFADNSADAAAMALVIFFVPTPASGVAEMARVVAPGGLVAAYSWDFLGGGFPMEPIQAELRAMGLDPPLPPSVGASRIAALRELWGGAGLDEVETREIATTRTFANFDEFWALSSASSALVAILGSLAPADLARLRSGVSARLPADSAGRITCSARANAVKGRVPR